jgi:hypothetical protein
MIFPPGYVFALSNYRKEAHFPQLGGNDFTFESPKDEDYNCVAWIQETRDDWIQFKDANGNLDVNLNRYVEYFKELSYEISDDKILQDGIVKIAIYYDKATNEFKHVARQLSDGRWASKLGDWEDIIHLSPEVLLGKTYGNSLLLMQRKV